MKTHLTERFVKAAEPDPARNINVRDAQRYAHLLDDPIRQGTNAVGEMLRPKLKLISSEPVPDRASDAALLNGFTHPSTHARPSRPCAHRALVGRMVVVARLKPIEHFTDELALRFRSPSA
jgi:hypothetical protein